MLFLFSKFKLKKWKKCSIQKKLNVVVAFEKKVAKWLGIEPLKIEVKDDSSNWNCFGSFMVVDGLKKIVINENLLYDLSLRFHIIETIAHETRHAYQFSIINKKLKWYNFTAKKWKRNWAGYFSSTVDETMYNNQSVERDAQKYSLKILRKFKYKYRNEEDYHRTYDAVLYRYETADDDARKKYGLFYKFKIEKKIKSNSKY